MQRLAIVLTLAGCRLHFDNRPADAQDATPDSPLALACNTPVKLADAPAGGKLTAAALGSSATAAWIEPNGQLVVGRAIFAAVDQVTGAAAEDPGHTGFSVVTLTAAGNVFARAYTQNGASFADVVDASLATLGKPTPLADPPGGPRAVAPTGLASDPTAAVTTIPSAGNQTLLYGINADGTITAALALGAGTTLATSSLVNIGDRLALVWATTANNCAVRTIDLAVTSGGATTGWGTANLCTEPQLGYAPGRSDALLVRHDLTDSDINHDIATRSGLAYTIPGESLIKKPGDEARPVGVADGYWVSYETAGTLEAVHVDFAAAKGTPVLLGPLADPTAHATVVVGGEPYAIWVQDGLEVAHLCP